MKLNFCVFFLCDLYSPCFNLNRTCNYVLANCVYALCARSTGPSSVRSITLFPQENSPAEKYDLEVVCDIDPSSTADYCVVIARNDDSTFSCM